MFTFSEEMLSLFFVWSWDKENRFVKSGEAYHTTEFLSFAAELHLQVLIDFGDCKLGWPLQVASYTSVRAAL